jgi:hypothetical protein
MYRYAQLLWLCLITSSLSCTLLYADELVSPLVQSAEKLHCANSESEAIAALNEIRNAPLADFGLPVDSQKNSGSIALHAASLDIVLRVLDETATIYPSLTDQVNDIVRNWNFCALHEDVQYLDLRLADQELDRTAPSTVFPAANKGLSRWGLLGSAPGNFRSPFADGVDKAPAQISWGKQCFPDPSTGELNHEDLITLYGSLRLATLQPNRPEDKYPYKWRPGCEVKLGELDGFNQGYEAGITTGLGRQNEELAKKGKQKEIDQAKRVEIMAHAWSKEAYEAGISNQRDVGFKSGFEAGSHTKALLAQTGVTPSSGSSPVIIVVPKSSGYGLAGSYYYSLALKDWSPSIGGSVSWSPKPYWFVRAAANLKYESHSNPFSYSWGAGYDDWHAGTFGLQLNNWGPIKLSDGLDLQKAIGAITYKVDSKYLQSKNIGASAALSIPVSNGNPSLQTNVRWSPVPNWYIYSGLNFPLDGKNPSWSYGFGRQDYRPFTFSFQYNNYGPNPILKDNFNKNGTLTIGGSWAF